MTAFEWRKPASIRAGRRRRAIRLARERSAAVRRGQEAVEGNLLGALGEIRVESRGERGESALVGADRPAQRMVPHPGDGPLGADDDPGLRAAEELVARKQHGVGPGREDLLHRRLVTEAVGGELEVAAGALVDPHRDAAPPPERDEIGELGRRDEAIEGEVRAVDHEDPRGVVPDRAREVLEMRAVGAADLDEAGPARGHDLGKAEGAADLDELAARHDHLAPGGVRREQEDQSGSVVRDDRGGLRPEVADQARGDRRQALAPLARGQVVLEGHVRRRAGRRSAAPGRGSCG